MHTSQYVTVEAASKITGISALKIYALIAQHHLTLHNGFVSGFNFATRLPEDHPRKLISMSELLSVKHIPLLPLEKANPETLTKTE